ncbi:MAG: hypothetical protein KatS3mg057_1020 [Herpetosiphonaceae bacterium]|nr:MAG: hypothetical protein KatS3mg057_1020 [Herpetosiphonaceae bacterium]
MLSARRATPRWSLGNGLVQDWSYATPMQRLSRLQVGASSSPGLHVDRSYSYDAVGNGSSIVDNRSSNSQSFDYDHCDRTCPTKRRGRSVGSC